jgi:hypothetical protein
MQKYQNAIQDVHGNAVASATVTVYLYGTLTPATIYSDNGLTVIPSSQVTTDSDGQFYFYADNGRYTLSVMATGFAQEQFSDVSLFDQADAGIASVKDYGAVGDGTTNDYAAFVSAFAASAGKRLRLPAGTYRIAFTGTTGLIPTANMTLEGDGADSTEIVFVPSSTAYRNLISVSNPLTVRGVKISLSSPAGGSAAFFQGNVTNLTLESCTFDGGTTNSGATISHDSYLINFSTSGTQTDVRIQNCNVTRFRYGFLKTNVSTSTQRRISVLNNDFYSNYDDPCQFNSPSGVMDDLLVQGNTFRDSLGTAASLTALHCSFASCTNFRVISNNFYGAITDALHVEENCINGVLSSNTFEVNGNGITLQDNNIGGTYKMPLNITIANNVLVKSGTNREAGKYGIWLINDATPEVPSKRVVVESNVVTSFERGIVSGASTDDAVRIVDNVANDCASGFYLTNGVSSIDNNTSSNCAIGIQTDSGGVCTNHKFVQCTATVTPSGRPLLVIDPIFEWVEQSVGAASTTLLNTFTWLNNRLYTDVTTHVICDVAVDRVSRLDQVTAGTTFTRTNRFNLSGGGALTLDCVDNSNVLAIQLFSSAVRTNVRLSAFFAGTCAIAP